MTHSGPVDGNAALHAIAPARPSSPRIPTRHHLLAQQVDGDLALQGHDLAPVDHFIPISTGKGYSARIVGIPDGGMAIGLGQAKIIAVPAHFLHAEGNFPLLRPALEDPVHRRCRRLPGRSPGAAKPMRDFDEHLQMMLGFHRRIMVSKQGLPAVGEHGAAARRNQDDRCPSTGAVSRAARWWGAFSTGSKLAVRHRPGGAGQLPAAGLRRRTFSYRAGCARAGGSRGRARRW